MSFTRKVQITPRLLPALARWSGLLIALMLGIGAPALCIAHCQLERQATARQQRAHFLCDYHAGEAGQPTATPRAFYELLPALTAILAGVLSLITWQVARPTPPLLQRWLAPPTPPPRTVSA